MNNKELIELWRQSTEFNFITWLVKRRAEFLERLRNRQLNIDEIEEWASEKK